MDSLSDSIIKWQKQYGRHNLPWQVEPTPYRVWVSEIMLQQTQVKTVIPYYQRFMQTCPTVSEVANLSENQLLLLWQGLGYYTRARNLHKASEIIDKACQFPDTYETLIALPGIGESTASAILSLAYQKPYPIMDGNVKRVFSRYFGIKDPLKQSLKILWKLAHQNTSYTDPRAYTQGLMDLGANICSRTKPKCNLCPLQSNCYANLHKLTDTLPKKTPKKPKLNVDLYLLLSYQNHKIGLVQRPNTGIWAKLFTPMIYASTDELPDNTHPLKPYKHLLTHRVLNIYPYYTTRYDPSLTYCDLDHIEYAIPTGIQPALNSLKTRILYEHDLLSQT
jgi:A/G-specific adenine glycosylase